MPCCTLGTAVAVSARSGMEARTGWVRREDPICRNSGRKSCPYDVEAKLKTGLELQILE